METPVLSQENAGRIQSAAKTPLRLCWADILRTLAMIAVMVQHLTFNTFWATLPPQSWSWQALNFYGAMTKWCVPVFLMLSGMLFLDPAREVPLKKLWGKHILRLVTAFLFWSALYVLYTNWDRLSSFSPAMLPSLLKQLVTGHYHMWFIYALLGLYLLVPLLRKFLSALSRRETGYFLLLWFLFASLLPALRCLPGMEALGTILDKMDMHFPVGFVGYFVLGRCLTAWPPSGRTKRGIYLAGLLGGFAGTLLLSFLSPLWGVPKEHTDFVFRNLSPNLVLMSTAVFVFFQQEVSRIRFSPGWKRRMEVLASCCFGAFLCHDFFISLYHRLGFTTDTIHPVFSVPVMLAGVAGGSFLFSWLFRKLPFARRYLT